MQKGLTAQEATEHERLLKIERALHKLLMDDRLQLKGAVPGWLREDPDLAGLARKVGVSRNGVESPVLRQAFSEAVEEVDAPATRVRMLAS